MIKIKYHCTGYISTKGFGNFLENNLDEPRNNINKFTGELKNLFKVNYLSLVNSGSSANLVSAMMLKELKQNQKKVILSTFSFPTTISAFKLLGFEVILCDIEKNGFNIDAKELEKIINEEVAAVVVTHFLGFPSDLEKISILCKKNKCLLIQDACETMNLKIENKVIYSYGDIITHSFYHPHHLSSYGGGAVIVNNQELFLLADSIIHWGRSCTCHFDEDICKVPKGLNHNFSYERLGINVEISELNACFGRFQLLDWKENEQIRNERYDNLFRILNKFNFITVYKNNYNISPFVFPITILKEELSSKLKDKIQNNGIEIRSLMGGAMYKQEVFKNLNTSRFLNSELLNNNSFFLGIHQSIKSEDFNAMLNILNDIFTEIEIEYWQEFTSKYPHEFTIQYPQNPEYYKQRFKQKLPKNLNTIEFNNNINLYLHIPFCEQKCSFCNFATDIDKSKYEIYVEALLKEFDIYHKLIKSKNIIGIDIGGGTPMILPLNLLKKILDKISFLTQNKTNYNYASIETTPNIASGSIEKLQLVNSYGFDRISIGIQTSDIDMVKSIGRRKQINLNKQAIDNIYNSGFKRVNIDLIFALPNQTKEIFRNDIDEAILLNPTSITIYDCLYSRDGRNFHKSISLPSMELYGELYDLGYNLLIKNGYYTSYGSVNFSKIPEETGTSLYFESRILKGESYLGLGNYATSYNNTIWSFNKNIDSYIQSIKNNQSFIEDFYELDEIEVIVKHILNNLNYGYIDKQIFKDKFNQKIENVYSNELKYALQKEWIIEKNNAYYLKYEKFKNLNYLRSIFYTDGMKKFMLNKERFDD